MSKIDPTMDSLVDHIDPRTLIKTRDDFRVGYSGDPPNLPMFVRADHLHINGLRDPDSPDNVQLTLEDQLILFCHGDSDTESWVVESSGISLPRLIESMKRYEPIDAVVSCNPAGYRVPDLLQTGSGVYYGSLYRVQDGKLHLSVMNNTQGLEVGQVHLTPVIRDKYFPEGVGK